MKTLVRSFNRLAVCPIWLRLTVCACVFLLVVCLGYFLVIKVVYLKVARATALEAGYQRAYVNNVANSKALSAIKMQMVTAEKIYRTLAHQLPENNALYRLIETLSELANQLNLKVTSLHPRPLVRKTGHTVLSIELNCEGSFQQLTQFIDTISRLPTIILIENYDLSLLKSNDNRRLLQLKMLLRTYSITVDKELKEGAVSY